MKLDRNALLLYAVTDRSWLGEHTLTWQVERALEGGATMVQLREKHLPREEVRRQALELKALCARFRAPLIINDDVELALEVGADGVHLGQEDLEAGQARRLLGREMILGVSAHSVQQALAAQAAGADYLGVGAMFPTGTKTDASPLPIPVLRDICAAVDIPAVAIGGIGPDNLPLLKGSGAAGAAVVSALFAQPDIARAARTLSALAREAFL